MIKAFLVAMIDSKVLELVPLFIVRLAAKRVCERVLVGGVVYLIVAPDVLIKE
jgi:hypothetical protein